MVSSSSRNPPHTKKEKDTMKPSTKVKAWAIIKDGNIMEFPEGCPSYIYTWRHRAYERFRQLKRIRPEIEIVRVQIILQKKVRGEMAQYTPKKRRGRK